MRDISELCENKRERPSLARLRSVVLNRYRYASAVGDLVSDRGVYEGVCVADFVLRTRCVREAGGGLAHPSSALSAYGCCHCRTKFCNWTLVYNCLNVDFFSKIEHATFNCFINCAKKQSVITYKQILLTT